MQTENRFFEDLSRMFNGAAGTLAGMGREAEGAMRERMREFLGGTDFVSREEFDAVKAMAAAARDEAEVLRARIDALEAANRSGAGHVTESDSADLGVTTPSMTAPAAPTAPTSGAVGGTTGEPPFATAD